MARNSGKIIGLILAVIASLKEAIATPRADEEALAKIRAEYEVKIADLKTEITDLKGRAEDAEADDAEIAALEKLLEETLVEAAAAKPPGEGDLANSTLPPPPEPDDDVDDDDLDNGGEPPAPQATDPQ